MKNCFFCLPLACALLALPGGTAFAADPEVKVVKPVSREVTDAEVFTGRIEARTTVQLRPRVSGYLTKVAFKDGASVKKGDVLFEIDPRPYQADAEKAEAAVNLAQAQLKLAEADYTRAKTQSDKGTLSREELDKAAAGRAEAEAKLAMAKANLNSARLTLSFTKVTAPFSGRLGRHLLDAGNVVKADETKLATLVSEGPLNVSFYLDERTFLRLRKAGKELATPVTVGLASEQDYPHKGQIDFVDNEVDGPNRTIGVRAGLANPDGVVLPGMFVRIRVPLGEPYKALLLPGQAIGADQTFPNGASTSVYPPLLPGQAIGTDQGRKFVYVVNEKNVIETRPVTLGPQEGDLVAVKEGLKAGDRVAVGELGKLRPGTKVKPREVQPVKQEK